MASVLNRATKAYLASVNTPDFPVIDWIINPDISAVAGQPSRYWNIVGDVVSLMSQSERNAVDTALLATGRDAVVSALTNAEDLQRAFMLLVMDELNSRTTKMNALLTAIDNAGTLAALKTTVAGIADLPARTEADLRAAIRNKLGS